MRRCIISLVVTLALTSCGERPELRYRTLEDALRESGRDDRFYSRLPRSSYDIVERYDIDTNEVWGSFRFRPGDEDAFQRLTRLHVSEVRELAVRNPGRVSWWPKELVGRIDAQALSRSGTRFFRHVGPPPHQHAGPRVVIFAIDGGTGIAYFWESGS